MSSEQQLAEKVMRSADGASDPNKLQETMLLVWIGQIADAI